MVFVLGGGCGGLLEEGGLGRVDQLAGGKQ